jgi:hypothetical protein
VKALGTCLILSAAVAIGGCVKQSAYSVQPNSDETLRERLDAQWFTRVINDAERVKAVELVYCPIQPQTPTVCRTAVVWVNGRSLLLSEAPTQQPPPMQQGTMPPPPPQPSSALPPVPTAPPAGTSQPVPPPTAPTTAPPGPPSVPATR